MKRLAAVCLSIWLGMQIGFGYVVAPILFKTLEKSVAGQLAGELFHLSNVMGILSWAITFLAVGRRSAWEHGTANRYTRKLVAILLVLFIISEGLVSPTIAGLKAGEVPMLANWLGNSFKMWHGVSSILHLLQTVLGLGLVIKLLRLQN